MDETPLTPLDPAYRTVLAISGALASVPVFMGAVVLESARVMPLGLFLGAAALVLLWLVLVMPSRRFRARGYTMADDRLRVVQGILFRRDTVVPFGRVQHLDVTQGPVERFFGLATLVMHTAGMHNASVSLPGLRNADALAMRETIRARIGRETL